MNKNPCYLCTGRSICDMESYEECSENNFFAYDNGVDYLRKLEKIKKEKKNVKYSQI
jgi:hypothetical protein